MAFQGDLFDFPLTDMLWFLENHNKSGWLTLTNRSIRIVFTFRHGQLVAARSNDIGQRLGSRLVAEGLLTEKQLRDALSMQEASVPPSPLGRIVVHLGYVSREQLQDALSAQFGELVFQLLIKPTGQFRFDPGIPDMRGEPINVSVQHRVFEAIRRADEWSADRLHDTPLKLNPAITTDTITLLERRDAVFAKSLLDGPKTLEELTRATGQPHDDVAAQITRLQACGIVYPDAQMTETDEIQSANLVA